MASVEQVPFVVLSRPAPGQPLEQIYLEVDAATQETHTHSNTMTDNPVEKGVDITDHIRPDPELLTAECIVTNTPISRQATARRVSSGGFDFLVNTAGGIEAGSVLGAAAQARDKLLKLRDEGILSTVVTTVKTYRSMAVQSVTEVRTVREYDAFSFTVTFKEIHVVENRLTRTRISKDRRVGKPKAQGAAPGAVDDDPDSALLSGAKTFKLFGLGGG